MSIQIRLKIQKGDFTLAAQFSAPATGLTAIFGPSGCGKTTLLRCIAGLDASEGLIKIGSTEWQDTSKNFFLPPEKREIAFIFQDARLLPHLSVRENILWARRLRKLSGNESDIQEIISQCGITNLLNASPEELSGGQRQRVCLARALATQPKLIVMDEPLSALDGRARGELLDVLSRFKSSTNIPILYVSHAMEEIAQLADSLVIMQSGRVEQYGQALEMFQASPEKISGQHSASVFVGRVIEVNEADKLAKVEVGNQDHSLPVWINEPSLQCGHEVRLLIYARDVSLSLVENAQQSTLNVMPVSIQSFSERDDKGRVYVHLKAGQQNLAAHITHRSRTLLALQPGMKVWAQIKALAVYS